MKLAVSITHADGSVTRWGGDEANPGCVPAHVSFTTTMPGGFSTAQLTLTRGLKDSLADLAILDDVVIYGPGGITLWEGRVQELPASWNGALTITVGCVGHVKKLSDDGTFREIYIDRSLSSWVAGSAQRQRAMTIAPWKYFAGSVDAGQLKIGVAGYTWSSQSGIPLVELVYQAAPIGIGQVLGSWVVSSGSTNTADPNWFFGLATAQDAGLTVGAQGGTNFRTTVSVGSVNDISFSPTNSPGWAVWQMRYLSGAAGGNSNDLYEYDVQNVAVVGTHGLALRGATQATKGFYASDIIANIVKRQAPGLATAGISATTFTVTHFAPTTPGTGWDAIQTVNGYHLYDIGVEEGKSFFFRQPDPARCTWQARLSDGATLDLAGDSGDDIVNGVVVNYTDPTGIPGSVGPPGATAIATSSLLADASPSNPANIRGAHKWAPLNLSYATDQAGATQIGAAFIAQRQLATRKGNMTVVGYVTSQEGIRRHCSLIRSGQFITVPDHSPSVVRRIVGTNYNHDQESMELTLDNSSNKLDAMMQRVITSTEAFGN